MIKTLLNLSVLLAPAASFAVVITFDDIPTTSSTKTSWLGNRYQGQNVLFGTDGTLGAFRYSSTPGMENMVGGADTLSGGDFKEEISAKFVSATNVNAAHATSSVSFIIRDWGAPSFSGNEWDVRIFD